MPVGIRFTGNTSPPPDTARPGTVPSSGNPIQDRIQSDAQAQDMWNAMGTPGGVNDILAANAARNQNTTSHAVGYGTSNVGYSQSFIRPNLINAANSAQNQNTTAAGVASSGIPSATPAAQGTTNQTAMNSGGGGINNNPFNMPLTFGVGTAGYYVRQTANQGAPAATGRPPPTASPGGSGGGGGAPNVPNFSWSPGGPNAAANVTPPGSPPPGNAPPNQPPQNTPGGNGGGGGSGGGSSSGGGRLPFVNRLGIGATSELLTGGLSLGIAGKVIEEIAFLPQHLLGLETSAAGNAKPYWDYRAQTSGLSRAGGFAGDGLSKQFYQGLQPPDWMQKLGLGPQQAVGLLQNFGIMPNGDQEQQFEGQTVPAGQASKALVRQLAGLKYVPGFGGLPEGQVEQSAGLFAKYGIFSDAGSNTSVNGNSVTATMGANPAGMVSQYSASMVDIIARAQELGLNRSEVMRSIDSTLQGAVSRGGGIGFTPEAVGNELLRYSALPGGRTGEVGMNMIQAADKFAAGVGTDPLSTIAYSGLSGRLKTEADITAYTEAREPGFMNKIKQNPASAALLQQYIHARNDGNGPAASQLLSDLFRESPALTSRVAGEEGAAGSFAPGYQHDLTVANSLGVRPLDVIGGNLKQQAGPGGPMNKDRAQQALAYYRSQGWSANQAAGITSYYAEETGGSFNPRAFNPKGGGQGAQGVGQWRGDRITKFVEKFGHSPTDPNISDDQLFREQLEFGQWELMNTNKAAGDALRGTTTSATAATTMVEKFGRPGPDTPIADQKAIGFSNRLNTSPDMTGLPDGMLQTQSQAAAAGLASSQISGMEAGTLIPKLNAAIQAMINGLSAGQQILLDPATLTAGAGHPQ